MAFDEEPPNDFGTLGLERPPRLLMLLVAAPLLALLLVLCRGIIPPVIGLGSWSVAVDFRYFIQFLVGVCVAPWVLIPFLFAWMPLSIAARVVVFVPALFLATAVGFIALAGAFGVPLWDMFRELEVFGTLILCGAATSGGMSLVPLGLRALRGCQLTCSEHEPVTKKQRTMEWYLLVTVSGFLFGGGVLLTPLRSNSLMSQFATYLIIWGFTGILVGCLTTASMIWLLRENSKKASCIVLSIHVIVCLVLPLFCFWVADFSSLPSTSFVGSGKYFIGLIGFFLTLSTWIFALRVYGYRVRKLPLEQPIDQPLERVVVDPFSD